MRCGVNGVALRLALVVALCSGAWAEELNVSNRPTKRGGTADPRLERILADLKPGLPKGWLAEVRGRTLRIEHDTPVPLYYLVAAPGRRSGADPAKVAEKERKDSLMMRLAWEFRIGPALTYDQFDALLEENNLRGKQDAKLRQKLEHIEAKGTFFPKTDEDRRLVAEYEQNSKPFRQLPVPHYFLPDATIYVYYSGFAHRITDESIQRENTEIVQAFEEHVGEYKASQSLAYRLFEQYPVTPQARSE